jgi:hypothetical protein
VDDCPDVGRSFLMGGVLEKQRNSESATLHESVSLVEEEMRLDNTRQRRSERRRGKGAVAI